MKVRFLLPILLLCTACATPIRSTVDGYGEVPLARATPLYFDRSAVPLADRPVVDACKNAAADLHLSVAPGPCHDCKRVEVRPRLAGISQAVESTGPAFGSSIGFFGGYTGFGLGIGSGNTSSHPETERVIDIGIFDGKKLIRSITARSVGARNSVAAVAYEMCSAALQEFPANVKGQVYDVKPKKQ